MPDPLDDLLKSNAERAQDAISSRASLGLTPSTDGPLVDAAARLGTTVDVLRGAQPVELSDALERNARKRVLDRNPDLARAIAGSPTLPTFAGDDMHALDNLTKAAGVWEDVYRQAPTSGERWQATMTDFAAGTLGGLSQVASIPLVLGTMVTDKMGLADTALGRGIRGRAMFLNDGAVQLTARVQGNTEENVRAVFQEAKDLRRLTTSVMGIPLGPGEVGSAGTSLLATAIASILSGGSYLAVLAAAGAQGGASTYMDLREKNDPEMLAKSVLSGLLTAATTKFLGPNADMVLAKMLSRSVDPKAALRTIITAGAGKTALGEGLEEGVDQMLQGILVNGKTFSESLAEAVNAGLIGFAIGGAVGTVGARANHSMKMQATKDVYAQDVALATAADLTQLSDRTKEGLKELMQTRPELAKAERVFAAEDLAPLLTDSKVNEALARLGVQESQVKAGVDTRIKMVDILALDAEVRDKLLPHARASSDAFSYDEVQKADAEKPAKAPAQGEKEADPAKKIEKQMRKEERRLQKELVDAGMDEASAKQSLEFMLRGARGLFALEPTLARRPLDLLSRIKFKKGEETAAEKLDKINKALEADAGAQGKPGLAGAQDVQLAAALGDVAGRLDVLTGRIELNPAAVEGEEDARAVVGKARKAKGSGPSLAGKTVKAYSPELETEVDRPAEQAVPELRDRLESARRFVDCVRS